MNRLLASSLLLFFVAFSFTPACAQSLPAPPQLQELIALKGQATQSVNALLQPGQRTRVDVIARRTQSDLGQLFGDPSAQGSPLLHVFSLQQLANLASALRDGRDPNVSDAQMTAVAAVMNDILMKAGPTWQRHAREVDSLLSARQLDRILAVRTSTLSKLPKFSFLGFDVFQSLAAGAPLGEIAGDPGSFVLLLALPEVRGLNGVERRQAVQSSPSG